MHQDYLLKPKTNAKQFKEDLLAFYDQRHIEYPAEHNVGHVYPAKTELHYFYKKNWIQPIRSTQVLVRQRNGKTGNHRPSRRS